ncbi:hypothetical protein [Peribacillus asahii]|uniref:hypothetical protein n=1 Tax=Peribacillus asahii TaxID=228899 RepID=UPI00207AD58A|nr:hypothetical protein [Peribacillus asahii]USK61358.1 hypothetical protein LIT37_08585 [Peribacillus asahii]
MNKNNNNIDVFLRKAALKKAYSSQMINNQTYSQEIYKIRKIEDHISQLEEQKQELLQQSKKRLMTSL